MKTARFNKRSYDFHSFKLAVDDAMLHLDEMKAAYRAGRVSKSFAERIMLAVTQVNGCRYCQYGHARVALKSGVTAKEIQYLQNGELGKLPPDEFDALMFAQHYAETAGNPDPDAWQRLVSAYGLETAVDIMAYIRMIMIGNLAGNTLDAFLSRLKGAPADGSSLGQELSVLLGSVVVIPASFVRQRLL